MPGLAWHTCVYNNTPASAALDTVDIRLSYKALPLFMLLIKIYLQNSLTVPFFYLNLLNTFPYMTYSEYSSLNGREKHAAMLKQGVQIAERTNGINKYLLYQLGSFYIERRFRQSTIASKKSVRSFSSTHLLMPYLRQINISGLI